MGAAGWVSLLCAKVYLRDAVGSILTMLYAGVVSVVLMRGLFVAAIESCSHTKNIHACQD